MWLRNWTLLLRGTVTWLRERPRLCDRPLLLRSVIARLGERAWLCNWTLLLRRAVTWLRKLPPLRYRSLWLNTIQMRVAGIGSNTACDPIIVVEIPLSIIPARQVPCT